jgi:hypothetical protein
MYLGLALFHCGCAHPESVSVHVIDTSSTQRTQQRAAVEMSMPGVRMLNKSFFVNFSLARVLAFPSTIKKHLSENCTTMTTHCTLHATDTQAEQPCRMRIHTHRSHWHYIIPAVSQCTINYQYVITDLKYVPHPEQSVPSHV